MTKSRCERLSTRSLSRLRNSLTPKSTLFLTLLTQSPNGCCRNGNYLGENWNGAADENPNFGPTPAPNPAPPPAPATATPTTAPTVPIEELVCNDFIPVGEEKWHDIDGPQFDCDWYRGGTNCDNFGDDFKLFEQTANQACCACGGGGEQNCIPDIQQAKQLSSKLLAYITNISIRIPKARFSNIVFNFPLVAVKSPKNPPGGPITESPTREPTASPTMAPTTPEPTASPTMAPTTPEPTASPTMAPTTPDVGPPQDDDEVEPTCVDVAGWYDRDGSTYDCQWYAVGDRCVNLGDRLVTARSPVHVSYL